MGNKREYVVLRANRVVRPRDQFIGLSGIRFRDSMIAAVAPPSVPMVDADELAGRDVDAIDAEGLAEVGAIDTPFDGGPHADETRIDEKRIIDVARAALRAPIGKVLSDGFGGSSGPMLGAPRADLEQGGPAQEDRRHMNPTGIAAAADEVIAADVVLAADEVISVAAQQRRPDGRAAIDFRARSLTAVRPDVYTLSARKGGGLWR